ncbi:Hamartin protein-domain-containing protein, partial [Gongronella butleri]
HQALLAMDQDEWSKNLLSILMAIGAAKTKPFFCLLDKYFQNSHDRLQIVYLLSEFMLRKYDNSTTLIAISVTNMIMLLPRICAMLPPFLPRLFYIFARAISWDQLRDMRKRQSIVASPRPKMDPTWDCAGTMRKKKKKTSVGFVVPEEFDEETFRTRTVGQVTRHMLHPTLVTMTAATELTDQSRWMKMEPPDVIALVMSLDLTNAASRSAFSSTISPTNAPNSMDLLDTSIWSATKDQTPTASSIATEETQEQREQQQEQQQQQRGSLPQKLPQHPLAPPLHHPQPQPMMETIVNMHKALKSGSEILAGDDIWPAICAPGDASTTSAAQQAAILQQAAANMSSETKLLIAGLKREVLLLRNELTFELFLKQQHLQHIGRLHREHVMDSTVEAERQQLYNANRMLRAQLTQTTAALEKLRTETAMAKQKHIKWEDDQSGKLRGYRDARKEWQAHMEVVKKDLDDLRLVVDDRTMELEQARKVIFDLQSEVTTLQPMVEKASNYEQRIRQLTQQMLLWEEDTAHLKEQKKYIKGLLSQWWSMEELVASLQAENRAHEEELS